MSNNEIALKKFNTVRGLLAQALPQMSKALPKHLTGDRLSRIALTEIRKNPKLLECNPKSFIGSIMECAQLGLEPGAQRGEAHLVPYYNSSTKELDCQFIIGYKGMLKLARNSGEIKTVSGHCVYSNEVFEIEYGLEERMTHIPIFGDDKERGEFKGAYAVVKLKDGGYQFTFVERAKIMKIRDIQLDKIKSDYGKKFSPWVTSFEEMAVKTAIRRLYKFLPTSVEISRGLYLDEQADSGEQNSQLLDFEMNEEAFNFDTETGEISESKISEVTAKLEANTNASKD